MMMYDTNRRSASMQWIINWFIGTNKSVSTPPELEIRESWSCCYLTKLKIIQFCSRSPIFSAVSGKNKREYPLRIRPKIFEPPTFSVHRFSPISMKINWPNIGKEWVNRCTGVYIRRQTITKHRIQSQSVPCRHKPIWTSAIIYID